MACGWAVPGLVLVGLASAAGCFDPALPAISCAETLTCPNGLVCDPVDLQCRGELGPDTRDAGPDSMVLGPDAAQADAFVDDGFCDDTDVVLCLRFEERHADDSGGMLAVDEREPIDYDDDGVRGKAGLFDGNGYLQVDDMISSNPHTVEMWVRLVGSDAGTLVAIQGSYVIRQIAGERIQWNNGLAGVLNSGPLAIGEFVHIAVVTGSSGVAMYEDGELILQVPFVSAGGVPNMSVGSSFGSAQWAGHLDQLRVWRRALSGAEVQQIFEDR